MKCYYEVLNVSREADNTEIKNAYRKLALKWHPDKNLANPDEAKEQFQTVQNAYEVLSDPQERAWYDNHREQLLRGAGSSFNDESLDLIPYFTPSCYKGFGDDDKGFYSVYREVFKKLAAEEVDYLDDPEDIKNMPMFGKSDTAYKEVHEFYAYWMSFSTSKSYVWLDKYDIREADNRKVLKLLEKENNKIRQKARKERNDEIRQFVSFVRKRDKRVQAYTKILQEKAEENKRKAENMRKEKLVQRQKEIEEAKKRQSDVPLYSMTDFHAQLEQIEKHYADEFGHSDEDTLTGPSDNEDDNMDDEKEYKPEKVQEESVKEKYSSSQRLYCTACDKLFKNIKSFENHENSKKHKENVMKMTLDVDVGLTDDDASPVDEEDAAETVNGNGELYDDCSDSDSPMINHITTSKKKKKNKKKPQCFEYHNADDETHLDDINNITRNRRARKAKNLEKVLSKNKEAKEEKNSANGSNKDEASQCEDDVSSTTNDLVVDRDIENIDTVNLEIKEETQEAVSEKTKPSKKVNKGKEKKYSQKQKDIIASNIDVTTIDTSHCCAICKMDFPSKNKLFDHLKKTGHQIYLPTAQVAPAAKSSKKKGGKAK